MFYKSKHKMRMFVYSLLLVLHLGTPTTGVSFFKRSLDSNPAQSPIASEGGDVSNLARKWSQSGRSKSEIAAMMSNWAGTVQQRIQSGSPQSGVKLDIANASETKFELIPVEKTLDLPEIKDETNKESSFMDAERMKTTADILATLSDTRTIDLLGRTMEMQVWKHLGKLAEALKGLSVFVAVISMFIPQPDDTEIIVNEIRTGFKNMENKINAQTHKLVDYLDELDINNNMIIPLDAQYKAMLAYSRYPDNSTFEILDRHCAHSPPLLIAEFILKTAAKKLENNYKSTKHDIYSFNGLVSLFRQRFIQAYMIHIFRSRIKYKELVGGEQSVIERFEREAPELEKIIQRQNQTFHATYLENTREIVRDVLDKLPKRPNHSQVATLVHNLVKQKYPWRNYSVLVYDPVRGYDKHAFFVYDNSSMLEFRYQDRNVVVLMASENYKEKAEKFRKIPKEKLIDIYRKHYDRKNLLNILQGLERDTGYEAQWGATIPVIFKGKCYASFSLAHTTDGGTYNGFHVDGNGTVECYDISICAKLNVGPNSVCVFIYH